MTELGKKIVYTIIDRADGKKFWLRIGTAFVNRDGSWDVRLDAMPVSGKMHVRDESKAFDLDKET